MITLTPRAEQQLIVLNALDRGQLLMAEAADLLGLSTRQVRRLRRAYHRHGPTALVHGNRGRRSPWRVSDAVRKRIVRLAQTTYAGVNHKHLSELLAEREGLTLSHPTIHRILRKAGLRSPRRRRPPPTAAGGSACRRKASSSSSTAATTTGSSSAAPA